MTMAVGLITHPEQANQVIVVSKQADFVAVARETLLTLCGLPKRRNILIKTNNLLLAETSLVGG